MIPLNYEVVYMIRLNYKRSNSKYRSVSITSKYTVTLNVTIVFFKET